MSLGSILLACPVCCVHGEGGTSARGTRAVGLWLFRKYQDLVSFAIQNWTDNHGAHDWNIYTDEAEAESSDVVFPAAMGPVRTEELVDNPRRNFDPRVTERYRPEATSWSNFTSVFDDRTSFRAKGLRGTT